MTQVLRALALALLVSSPAAAQSSGAAGADSTDLGFVARLRAWVRDTQILERLNGEVNGWYPRVGGITRGSGLAGGPGYRVPLFDEALFLDLSGAMSIKGYKALDVRARWLRIWRERLEFWTEIRYEDFPQEDFFGIGMSSAPGMRTSYDFDSVEVLTRAVLAPRPWARLTGTVALITPDVGSGTDDRYPSIEERFGDGDAPGLRHQPAFLYVTLAAGIDTRSTRGNPASGGIYRASYGRWNDIDLDAFDLRRLDLHAMHFVPITPGRAHVLSGRLGARSVAPADGRRIPFYALAYVGGMDTVRSLQEFRFQDAHALWASAEYTWRPRSYLSVAYFADAGQAHARRHDISRAAIRTGHGIGVGLHSSSRTIVRVDAGTGAGEGWQVFVAFRPDF